jgi:hypothetical protein
MTLLMNKLRHTIVSYVLITIGAATILFSSCKGKSYEGMMIFTRAASKVEETNYQKQDSWRFTVQAQIVAINPWKPEEPLMVLTSKFYSARSPEISYDGKHLLFTAKQKENDPWQIWEMDLKDQKSRQLTSSLENCTDPAYLPGGRLVFSKSAENDSLKAGHSLFTGNLDGTGIKRITFNPYTYYAPAVLKDGRVLTVSRQVHTDQSRSLLFIMRPDGTKSQLFYNGFASTILSVRGWETINRKIVFIESEVGKNDKSDIISISYNRPLHSRENLTSQIQGDFHDVFPMQSGNFLVSYRKTDTDNYALYEFDPVKKVLGQAISANDGYDELEAVEVHVHDRPKKLPSEVDMGVKTGLLMSQDINVHNTVPSGKAALFNKASDIEIMGLDSLLGVVQPEEDGSIYIKVMADKPFQIKTLDKEGRVIQTCAWIWLRPNERRGCVGCHEDQELVPQNKIPRAVKKAPVKIPNHINKIVEKQVELE